MKELLEMTAAEQAQAIRTGAVGVEELTTFYINRIEKYGMSDGLNAVSQLRDDALKRARRLDSQKPGDGQYLYGLPVLVKDNIDVAGLCTTAGSMALNDNLVLNVADRELVGEEQMRLYDGLLGRLEQGGAKIYHVNQPRSSCLKTIMKCEFKRDLEEYLKCSSAKLKTLEDIIACYEANPERMMRYGISLLREAVKAGDKGEVYAKALAERARQRKTLEEELAEYHACVMMGSTNIMHLAGLPSAALKLGLDAGGMPRGIILYGVDEERLLSAAQTVEGFCGDVPLAMGK